MRLTRRAILKTGAAALAVPVPDRPARAQTAPDPAADPVAKAQADGLGLGLYIAAELAHVFAAAGSRIT